MHRCYVYKVTFPNGKIYVGSSRPKAQSTSSQYMTYFGSGDFDLIDKENYESIKEGKFTVKKEILFSSNDLEEVRKKEHEFIIKEKSTDPKVGYNKKT
jgi:hypothetical protein